MKNKVKEFFWRLLNNEDFFNGLNAVLMRIPGSLGLKMRYLIFSQFFEALGKSVSISCRTRFTGFRKLRIGDNVSISENGFIQASGGVYIGNNVILGADVKIWSINHIFNKVDVPIIEQGHTQAEVKIEDDVLINDNVFVMPGVHLPRGCVVMACSVVNLKKYLPYSILAGHPCRVIGMRIQTSAPKTEQV